MITTKEADDNMKAYWSLNDKYPDYLGCVIFDHKSLPFHDMELCKLRFLNLVKSATDKKITELNQKIEILQENGQDITFFLSERKRFRSFYCIDVSACKTIDELITVYPKDL